MHEDLFSAFSLTAIAGWLLLAVGAAVQPGRLRDRLLVLGGRVLPLALCAAYAAVLLAHWGSAPGGGFGSLAAVQALLAPPGKMLGAWTHFLAFDLLVGRWIVDDALRPGRSRLALLPGLPLVFLYGPLGLLVYLGAQALLRLRLRSPAG